MWATALLGILELYDFTIFVRLENEEESEEKDSIEHAG